MVACTTSIFRDNVQKSNMLCIAGIQYTNLPIDKIRHVMSSHAQEDDYDDEDDEPTTANQAESLQHLQQPINGIHLYVCCHGSRDTRCGNIGNRLARALDRLVQERQMQGNVQVFKCSHVGGHKVCPSLLPLCSETLSCVILSICTFVATI